MRNESESQPESVQMQPQDLLRSLMDITISELKLGHEPWQKLAQHKQDAIIDRVANRARELVREMLSLISSEGFRRVSVMVDQIVIKDGIKAQISLGKSEAGRHHLYEAQGQLCTLVLVDAEQFTDAPHGFRSDPQQLPLPLGERVAAEPEPVAEPSELPQATQDKIEALEQRIREMREANAAAGAVEDSPEITDLVCQRDLMMLALAQQAGAEPDVETSYLQNEEIARAFGVPPNLIDKPAAESHGAALERMTATVFGMLQQPGQEAAPPTQADLEAIDQRLEAMRFGDPLDENPEVVELLERRAKMVEAIKAGQVVADA